MGPFKRNKYKRNYSIGLGLTDMMFFLELMLIFLSPKHNLRLDLYYTELG